MISKVEQVYPTKEKPNALEISLMSCFENLNFARGEITPACFEACMPGL